ncbi:lipid A deacylase LpxR family protein [Flavobacterium sp. LaA7.5]|nr:lipid A deacylase LpxR family protein [Flavobacterium salilacus subsp. altitudinum]
MWSLKHIIIAVLCTASVWAQKPAEMGVILDNDLYSSVVNDQYYTNGIEFFYRYLGTAKNEKIAKKITEFRAGQYIYNPQSVRAEEINVNDRPFAGYLFAEAGINTYYKSESVLKLNFQVGVVGPESFAEDMQEGLHKVLGYPTVRGWQHQITTLLGLQANMVYSRKILRETYKEKVDFHLQGELNAGTVWTGASVGAMARINLHKNLVLKPIYNSMLHNATVSHDKESYKGRRELFLFLNPNINYQIYDATIQGSLFNDDSPVTFPLIPVRFNAEFGVKYGRNNWNLSYSVNYRGKELSNSVITGYHYGSIVIGYLL